LEAAIGDRLADSKGCPDPLWDKLKGHLVAQSTARMEAAQRQPEAPVPATAKAMPPGGWRRLRGPLSYLVTAAAAVLLTMLAVPTMHGAKAAGPEVVFTDDLEAFVMDADVPGDYEKVARGLVINGFNVNLKRPSEVGSDHPHNVQILGMRAVTMGKHKAAQVYFACCGRPVTVILTPRDDAAWLDAVDLKGMPPLWTERHSMLDGYAVVAIGSHDPQEVASLFQ